MKNEELYEVLSDINEDYVNQAHQVTQKKPKSAWRRWIPLAACLGLIVVVLGILWASNEQENSSINYRLVKEDGSYYIVINIMAPNHSSNGPKPCIYYHSMEEMISDIENGNFTKEEFFRLSEHPRTQDGKIKAPNLDALLEPIVPDSAGDYRIDHYGDAYDFLYKNPEGASDLAVSISKKQYHDSRVEKFLNYEEELAGRDQLAVTWVSERNATVYTWVAHGKSCQYILYTLSANETVYYVEERYADAESGILDSVYIWFEYQGEYIYVHVNDPEERPSIEWITSFAVKPYER